MTPEPQIWRRNMYVGEIISCSVAAISLLWTLNSAHAGAPFKAAAEKDARATIACLVRVWLTEFNDRGKRVKPHMAELIVDSREGGAIDNAAKDAFNINMQAQVRQKPVNWPCTSIDAAHYDKIVRNPIIDTDNQYGKSSTYNITRCHIGVPTRQGDLIAILYRCGDYSISPSRIVSGHECGGDRIDSDLSLGAALFQKNKSSWTLLGFERFGEADMRQPSCPKHEE